MRFSEAIFLLPLALLVRERKGFFKVIIVSAFFIITELLIIGISDLLYWKKAFFTLLNHIDYTLVKGLSSHGFQPIYKY